jgi:uncharacterized protein YodC (DUF2158 family)
MFKVGDVVKLNSGGPTMTVSQVESGGGHVRCIWFSGDDLKVESFDPVTLKSADASNKASF